MKTRITVFIYLIITPVLLWAQNEESYFRAVPNLNDPGIPTWARLMYSENPSAFEVQRQYDLYYTLNPFEKNIHTQNYKNWKRATKDIINDEGFIDPVLKESENKFYFRKPSTEKSTANWIPIGPEIHLNGANSATTGDTISFHANIQSIDQSLSDPNTVYCGTESGGLFKSTDQGVNWSWASYNSSFKNVKAVAIHPTDPATVYIATGNSIFKTTDSGTGWSEVLNVSSLNCEEIIIDPSDGDNIFATSRNHGLYRSTDGGANWTNHFTGKPAYDVDFKPGDSDVVYVLTQNTTDKILEFHKSTDDGVNWTHITTGWYNSDGSTSDNKVFGARMTVTDADSCYIYVIVAAELDASDAGYLGLFKSTDCGDSWSVPSGHLGDPYWYDANDEPNSHPNLCNHNPNGTSFHQGYYNLGIAASDSNKDEVIIGTVSLWRTLDGGSTFQGIGGYRSPSAYPELGYYNIHPDIQELLINGSDIWIATDGGINYSDNIFDANNPGTSKRNKGLFASEYWGFGQGWNEDIVTGGRYHNGDASFWKDQYPHYTHLFIGGGESATGFVNPGNNLLYHSDRNNAILPTSVNNDAIFPGGKLSLFPNQQYIYPENSEIEYSYHCYNHLWLGKDNILYKSEDGGQTFNVVKTFTGTDPARHKVFHIELSRSNPNVIYVFFREAQNVSTLYRSVDGGLTWVEKGFPAVGSGPGQSGNQNGGTMTLDPTDENTLWVAFYNNNYSNRGKVFKTTDGGNNWTDLTTTAFFGEKPSFIVHQAGTNGLVYLGTNYDIYYRDNSMSNWSDYNTGLPIRTNVARLVPFYRDGVIRAATFGNGIWESPLTTTSTPIVQPSVDKITSNCVLDTFYFEDYSILNHNNASWTWSISPVPDYIDDVNKRNPKVVFGNTGTYSVTLDVTVNSIVYSKQLDEDIVISESVCDIVEQFPGQALEMQGYCKRDEGLPLNTNELTMTAWVNPTENTEDFAAIFSFAAQSSTANLNFKYDNASATGKQLGIHWYGNWGWDSGLFVPFNQWSFVAMSVNPTGITICVNGDCATNSFTVNAIDLSTGPMYIGRDRGYWYRELYGFIDEAIIYDRSLSIDEIRCAQHLIQDPSTDSSIVAYYQFNNPSPVIYEKVNQYNLKKINAPSLTGSCIPLGPGECESMNIQNAAFYDYSMVGCQIDFTGNSVIPDGDVFVHKIQTVPDTVPGADMQPDSVYWIITNYGDNTNFDELTSLAFNDTELANADYQTFNLYTRTISMCNEPWLLQDNADDQLTGGHILFSVNNGISSFGHYSMTGTILSPDCPQDTIITTDPIMDGLYEASNSISTGSHVPANGNVIFHAGNFIEMTTGFEVIAGGKYVAKIQPCSN